MNKVVDIEKRDYSLVGSSAQRALELGLASAEWYRSDVPRATMKELVRRSDAPAISRHHHLDRGDTGVDGRPHLLLGQLVGRALHFRVWRALRLFERLPLARMRARHRLSDRLDERGRLPDSQFHADA